MFRGRSSVAGMKVLGGVEGRLDFILMDEIMDDTKVVSCGLSY
jgi:hypothetical protein